MKNLIYEPFVLGERVKMSLFGKEETFVVTFLGINYMRLQKIRFVFGRYARLPLIIEIKY